VNDIRNSFEPQRQSLDRTTSVPCGACERQRQDAEQRHEKRPPPLFQYIARQLFDHHAHLSKRELLRLQASLQACHEYDEITPCLQ